MEAVIIIIVIVVIVAVNLTKLSGNRSSFSHKNSNFINTMDSFSSDINVDDCHHSHDHFFSHDSGHCDCGDSGSGGGDCGGGCD